ncbi:MAG: PQQ-binding-like beta-propeller repeat protein [Candidatus Thermoplasmatota archaeon]
MLTQKLITQVLVIFLVLSLCAGSNLFVAAKYETNGNDGFWTMTFDSDDVGKNISLNNCIVDDNAITLNYNSAGRTYDFKKDSTHKAYSYVSSFFIPFFFHPTRHITYEDEFNQYTDIVNIRSPNDGKTANRSSSGFKKYVVQHFRFKINPDSADTLEILWRGRADDDKEVCLFYWQWFVAVPSFGTWIPTTSAHSNNTYLVIKHELQREQVLLAVNSDNYLDVCVVCKPKIGSCTLATDYVRVLSKAEKSYEVGTGFAETKKPIDPQNISGTDKFYWESLSWDDYERSGATVTYQVLFLNASGNYSLVEERYLPGNLNGFTESPVYLHTIPPSYKKLKIRANLTTTTETSSPKIYRWTVTWQTLDKSLHWQDLFYSDFRTETKHRVTVGSGYVTVRPVTGNWPMFGQNPANTRISEGKGPLSSELNWYAVIKTGKPLTNQVISEGVLYVTYEGSKDLYLFNNISIKPPAGEYEIPYSQKIPVSNTDKEVVAAPTITDRYVIVATGSTSPSGTQNYIYALDRLNNLNEKWRFTFNDNICYWASPAVFEDKVFVTSWSGDPDMFQSNSNNKLIALALDRTGHLTNNDALWIFSLPAKSLSTPAVADDMVIVACAYEKGDSIFAVDINSGKAIWNQSVGSVNRASPVIYDDKVFIIGSKGFTTTLTALSLSDGKKLWSQTLSIALKPGVALADSTPAVVDDVIYAAAPNGMLYALNVSDGTERWSRQIYTIPLTQTTVLSSSPAIADDVLYIGTPEGKLFCIKTNNGENMYPPFITFQPDFVEVPICTSSIISNGLVFFGDSNGVLYALGSYQNPTTQISGYVISNPIYLPKNYWWKNFYAVYDIPRNSTSSITFSLLDSNSNVIKPLYNRSGITLENRTLDRVLRLRADLSAENITVNPKLLKWNITFQTDANPPSFNHRAFTPDPNGWINTQTPTCTIPVWDNTTGLVVTSATYTLGYTLTGDTTVYSKTVRAQCTGVNGSQFATLTANISMLDFSRNISSIKSISFSIYDLAGNLGKSNTISFKQDIQKPTSRLNPRLNNSRFNMSKVFVNATVSDPAPSSGIVRVELLYRFSKTKTFSGSWKSFGSVVNTTKPQWNITTIEGGGYYELACRATDKAGNSEDLVNRSTTVIIFDNIPPEKPIFDSEYSFSELPQITVEFKDDFQLHSIWYRPYFESSWTLIAEKVYALRYVSPWTLKTEFWNMINEDVPCYLFFRINDTLNNVRYIENESEALKLVRDSKEPLVDIDIPNLDFQWNPSKNFTIRAIASDLGSGVKQVQLFYRYSDDNNFENKPWKLFGDSLQREPFLWNFLAQEGNGYYQFYIRAEDMAGNVAESKVFSTGVHIFPEDIVLILVALIITFLIILSVVSISLRKKN